MKFFSKFLGPNKKVEQLIHILITNTNYREVKSFLAKQKKSFLADLPDGEVIRQILKKPWSRKKYKAFSALTQMVQIERSRDGGEEDRHLCNIPPIYNDFHSYMYTFDAFGSQQIPWEEWDDIAKLKIDALEDIFNKGELKGLFDKFFKKDGVEYPFNADILFENKYYNKFCDEHDKRYDELINKGYTQLIYAGY